MTSMMTPPLSISARPVFRRRLVEFPLFCDMVDPLFDLSNLFFSSKSFAIFSSGVPNKSPRHWAPGKPKRSYSRIALSRNGVVVKNIRAHPSLSRKPLDFLHQRFRDPASSCRWQHRDSANIQALLASGNSGCRSRNLVSPERHPGWALPRSAARFAAASGVVAANALRRVLRLEFQESRRRTSAMAAASAGIRSPDPSASACKSCISDMESRESLLKFYRIIGLPRISIYGILYHTTFMPRETTAFPLSLPAPPAREVCTDGCTGNCAPRSWMGGLRPGARLPATRDLASAYHLSRATIVTAFDQLKSEGYVEGRAGSGTYVSEVLPEHLLDVQRAPSEKQAASPPYRVVFLRAPFAAVSRVAPRPLRAFRANQPALDLFPTNLWAQVAARRLRRVRPTCSLVARRSVTGHCARPWRLT